MRLLNKFTVLSILSVGLLLGANLTLSAAAPAKVMWLQQSGTTYDSTSRTYLIDLEWKPGAVNENSPQPDGFNVYRSVAGYDEEPEEYELVGTVNYSEMQDGIIAFTDEVTLVAVYSYYVRAYKGEELSEISSRIMAVAQGSYCVDLNAEIIDFVSFPNTIGIPGKEYTYTAYARHRSSRVQGLVRYHLTEGPEGMTLDNKKGQLSWVMPEDAEGNYYVEIKATSLEDSDAESVQHWYIRTATQYELIDATSVNEIPDAQIIKLFPNPAGDYLQISPEISNQSNLTEILIYDTKGYEVISGISLKTGKRIDVSGLAEGVYYLRAGTEVYKFIKK